MKRNAIILLIAGILVVALSQIIDYYSELPEFVNGIFLGTGLGLLVLAIFKIKGIKSNS